MIRTFWFWCPRCPTRITVETEVSYDEYTFALADGVGLVQARQAVDGDDGLEVSTLCPACGAGLEDLDDLLARQIVPYHDAPNSSRLHAAWRAKERR